MGIGKSTLTTFLAEKLSLTPVYENFRQNPFLAAFYKNMKRWALHSQMFFMTEKINQLLTLDFEKKGIVQDTPIYEDVYSYAKAQYVLKNINKHEWGLYMKTFKLFEKHLPVPRLIIHLSAPVEVIYKRIQKRKRDYETETKKTKLMNYLKVLDELNSEWISSIKKKLPVLRIDTHRQNYIYSNKRKNDLISEIKGHL